ncbi:MAG: thrombospondin type 3 repeat-containing protein [Myxococcota bacterium]|nr:thrombospondin type 3 repeat-containing protein [Myxococcota bacterium]
MILRFSPAQCLLLAICMVCMPRVGWAQTMPSTDIRTWRPSSDPEAGLVLEPAVTPGPWQWNVGLWVSYAQSPVVLRDAATGRVAVRPLHHLLGADLVAGIGLGERAALGIDLPVFVWQDGTSSLPPTFVSGGAVPTTGVGDIALLGKGAIVSNDRQGVRAGLGLAALGAVTLPSGNRASFMGDGSPTVSVRLLVEYALVVGAARAALGYRARTTRHTWPDEVDRVTFGDEIPWSIDVALRPKAIASSLDSGDRQEWEIGLHGSLPAGPVTPFGHGAAALSPVLLAAGDRIVLGHYRDNYLLFGGDFGLDDAVGVPAFRAVVSLGWAPRSHDRDADGVPDDVDECPDLPEDKDGIQDNDGCPEDDADGDGVPDSVDACPLVPGAASDDPKKNGCPPDAAHREPKDNR